MPRSLFRSSVLRGTTLLGLGVLVVGCGAEGPKDAVASPAAQAVFRPQRFTGAMFGAYDRSGGIVH